MFIKNYNDIQNIFKCHKLIGKYIVNKYKIPILSIEESDFIFSKTEKLEEILKKLPIFIKFLLFLTARFEWQVKK